MSVYPRTMAPCMPTYHVLLSRQRLQNQMKRNQKRQTSQGILRGALYSVCGLDWTIVLWGHVRLAILQEIIRPIHSRIHQEIITQVTTPATSEATSLSPEACTDSLQSQHAT